MTRRDVLRWLRLQLALVAYGLVLVAASPLLLLLWAASLIWPDLNADHLEDA